MYFTSVATCALAHQMADEYTFASAVNTMRSWVQVSSAMLFNKAPAEALELTSRHQKLEIPSAAGSTWTAATS